MRPKEKVREAASRVEKVSDEDGRRGSEWKRTNLFGGLRGNPSHFASSVLLESETILV